MDFSVFPVAGDAVKCGLRKDLPSEERHHQFVPLGIDTRHFDDGAFVDALVFACFECGQDKMKDARPRKPKPPVPPPLDPEVKARRDDLRRRLFAAHIGGEARASILALFDKENKVKVKA